MERNEFIKGIADYSIIPDVYAKRQGNIVFIDIYADDDADDILHFDAYIDDRCYRQDATYLQPAEDGYAVDAVAINWSAFNEKTFHLTDDEKKEMCRVVTESGADFIKTSTGKIGIGATPEAFYVMCNAIKDYYNETGTKIGIKAAGGIRTANDAAKYYTIASEILGEEWMNKDLFRIGAASLANNLIAAINE